jgi:hypothetical protein
VSTTNVGPWLSFGLFLALKIMSKTIAKSMFDKILKININVIDFTKHFLFLQKEKTMDFRKYS